jgi:hypothetical protein
MCVQHARMPRIVCRKYFSMIRVMDMHATGGFWGYTDKLPDEEEAGAVNRARDNLLSAKTYDDCGSLSTTTVDVSQGPQ